MEFRAILVLKTVYNVCGFEVFIDDIRNAQFQFKKMFVQFSLILTESHRKFLKFMQFS